MPLRPEAHQTSVQFLNSAPHHDLMVLHMFSGPDGANPLGGCSSTHMATCTTLPTKVAHSAQGWSSFLCLESECEAGLEKFVFGALAEVLPDTDSR